jgi:hypothetical protein
MERDVDNIIVIEVLEELVNNKRKQAQLCHDEADRLLRTCGEFRTRATELIKLADEIEVIIKGLSDES